MSASLDKAGKYSICISMRSCDTSGLVPCVFAVMQGTDSKLC